MKMSKHCEIYRQDRVDHIKKEIGLGQIVREKYVHTAAQIAAGEAGRYLCVTDTGIMIIKSEDKATIITMYVATYRELVSLYGGERNIPKYLHKKVDRNQSKFTNRGKTIWR